MPKRQQGLQGQQVQGLFGPCRAIGSSECPTSLPALGRTDGQMDGGASAMPGATLLERLAQGVDPSGKSQAACSEDNAAACSLHGPAPAWGQPCLALPAQRLCRDFATPDRLQCQVGCFCPCFASAPAPGSSSSFVAVAHGWPWLVSAPIRFRSSSLAASGHLLLPLACFRSTSWTAPAWFCFQYVLGSSWISSSLASFWVQLIYSSSLVPSPVGLRLQLKFISAPAYYSLCLFI